ncbi:MAG: GNAT family N-acetyltransferase [Candidatus Thiodiazotropha sp. L084R]
MSSGSGESEIMEKPAKLETERLTLRQWRMSDLEPFAQLNSDSQVMACFPAPLDRIESDALADRCRELIQQRGWGFWAVELRETRSFIGFVGLHIPSAELPFSPCVEIGWRIAVSYWGKGYATEAANSVLSFGFEQLGLQEIVSFTTIGNRRSRRVMERLGMRDTACDFDHPAVPLGHPLSKHSLYRLSKSDWLSAQ